MPNHVENILKIKGTKEEIKEVKDFLKGKWNDGTERNIDFNNITPMPKWVYRRDLSSREEEKYGRENCWYGWSRKNWGTKWNAYESEYKDTENTIRFRTAWNNVFDELMRKLGFIFPNVEFEYSWSDEDFGYNVGRIRFKDTEILDDYIPKGGTEEAYKLTEEIWENINIKEYLKEIEEEEEE